ncbi:MAG: pseudouridine synthase [Nitrospiraceae bacterium]|nr:pseudouridine synthase [Nitrospiraceae bacterium]
MIRLQKYLAECGVASRRAAEKIIEAGRVSVNGEVARLGMSVDPASDEVMLDGKPIEPQDKVYIILNKPKGTITTAKDTHGRPTALSCVTGARGRVFPVGRLDLDVEGALLLTNDGELAYRLTHPSYEVKRVYQAYVRGRMTPAAVAKLERGVELEDGKTAPAQVEVLQVRRGESLVRLTIHEGRKREVKRMFQAVGHRVRNLERLSMGGIRADGLRTGEWRYLSAHEVDALRELTKMPVTRRSSAKLL